MSAFEEPSHTFVGRLLAPLGSKSRVCSRQEHRTFLAVKGIAADDPEWPFRDRGPVSLCSLRWRTHPIAQRCRKTKFTGGHGSRVLQWLGDIGRSVDNLCDLPTDRPRRGAGHRHDRCGLRVLNAAVVPRRRVRAANWNAIWYLLSAFAVISYTDHAIYVAFAALGSWIAAFVPITWLVRIPRSNA